RKAYERIDLPLEPLRFFPERRRRPGTKRISIEPERQVVSAEPGGPQPRGETLARQRGQFAERSHTPPAERRGDIRNQIERGDGDLRERRALAPRRDDRDGARPARL